MDDPQWLQYAKKLKSIAQSGLAYSDDKYDLERFRQIRKISIEIMEQHSRLEDQKIEDFFEGEQGYTTPKIDARAAIFRDNKILLAKEKSDGHWSLPGGWADTDLTLKENLIKEAREEAGANIEPRRIIAIQDRSKHNNPPDPWGIYKIFVECDCLNFDFESNIETSDAQFFSLESLPPLSKGRNTEEQIRMCFQAHKSEYHEPIFD